MTVKSNKNQAFVARQSYRVVPLLLLVATLCVLTFITGGSPPLPNLVCAQDLGFIIDAGYRFYQGQIAHLDYRSPLGPVLGAFVGLPLLAFGAEYESFKFVPITATWIFSIWALTLTWRLTGPALACLLSLAVGLYGGGLFHLGFSPEALTFAVFYNRLGFAILTLGIMSLIRSEDTATYSLARYVSFGAAFTLLFFLKINFAFFLVVSACLQFGLGILTRSELFRLALSAAIFALVGSIGIQFRFDLMFDDLARAASARSTIVSEIFFPLRNLFSNLDFVLLVGLLVGIGSPLSAQYLGIKSFRHARWIAQCAFPFLIGYGITLMQSHGDGRLVLSGIAGFVSVVAAYTNAKCSFDDVDRVKMRLAKSLLCAACIIIIVPHLISYSTLYKCRAITGAQTFNAPGLKGLIVGGFNSWGDQFVPFVNEATDLVERHVPQNARMEYVDYGNIITFGTGRRNAKGAPYVWDKTSTLALDRPLPDSVFKNIEFMLLPKSISIQGNEVFSKLYGYLIQTNYILIKESSHFALFRRTE